MKTLKYTNKWTISYCLALIQIVYLSIIKIAYISIISIDDISRNYMLYYNYTYVSFENIVRIVIAIISLSLGFISLFQKEPKRAQSILSIIISALVLIEPILNIFKRICLKL